MKKVLSAILLMFTCTSLYAYTSDDRFLFLGGGYGLSYGHAENDHGDPGEYYSGGDEPYFKSAECEKAYTKNFTLSAEIFLIDNLALSLGISKEFIEVKIISPKDNAAADAEYLFDFEFMTIPVGIHYYYKMFFLGGGMYRSLMQDRGVKVNDYHEDLHGFLSKDDYGFFIDTGSNIPVTEKLNI